MKIHHPGFCRYWVSCCVVFFLLPGFNQYSEACQSSDVDASPSKVSDEEDGQTIDVSPRQNQTKFLRVNSDEFGNPVALQTASTKYVLKNDKGDVEFEVFLESVIHIADSSYYRSFQQRFEQYDAVLYELVSDRAAEKSKEENLPGGYQLFQQLSTGTLGLAYQLDEVDYSPKNMVHADLSQTEMAQRMADRGESSTTLLVDLLSHIIKRISADQENQTATAQIDIGTGEKPARKPLDVSLLTDPNGIMKIRRMMATTLVDSQLLDSSFPPSIHRLIVSDRNDRVMSVLNKTKKKGNQRVAIFYGAGHMADFEKRLVEEHGMEMVDVNWRNAWDLRDGAIQGGPLEGLIESTFRESFKNKLRQFARGQIDKSESGESDDADESAKDEKIKSMESTLKALEARLKQLESGSNEGDKKSSDGSDPKTQKQDKKEEKTEGVTAEDDAENANHKVEGNKSEKA